ncbi:flagellar hook-length control protein FliK [Brucella pseudogrignonensis]|uniref:flagellar hook-length control protein FliK n=1 Tax=Brucella pseudogrignonensis TaxID=419475 RepID=UPI0028BC831E|nr:flagellar hook-length control protein FliK [Brucella pseudogrignonensis]MDT6941257.1 flagellar hook-length control protein FliK [Brucella pseudogrignonensis]
MSVDLLLTTAGRLASLAKSTGAQQGAVAKANGENQEQSEPAKLFGALLEKSQNKLSLEGEQKDETQSEDSDKADRDTPAQSSVYGVSQSLLALAAGFNNPKDEDQLAACDNATKQSMNVSALAEAADPALTTAVAVAADLPMPDAEPKKDQKENVQANKQTQATADSKGAAKPENLASHTPPAVTKDQQTESATDGSSASPKPELTLQSSNAAEADRPNVQPQQQIGKSAPVADAKAPTPAAPTAAARIADIQVLSERSFGAVKTLQIRLDPVELGAVTARIRLIADSVEVHLVADKAHAAEALAADRSMIEKALKVAGITDDTKISVTVTERGAVSAVQHSSASHSAGQQQASSLQQGQQTFDMQNGSDGRGNAQAQFMGGEGRQNGESGQADSNNARTRSSSEANEREISALSGGRNRGLVV